MPESAKGKTNSVSVKKQPLQTTHIQHTHKTFCGFGNICRGLEQNTYLKQTTLFYNKLHRLTNALPKETTVI